MQHNHQRLWTKVRNTLERLPAERRRADRNKHGALLKGLLHCALCDQTMQPVYTQRGVRRYGYYVCPSRACRNRLAARSMEESVVRQLARSAGGRKVRQLVRSMRGPSRFRPAS